MDVMVYCSACNALLHHHHFETNAKWEENWSCNTVKPSIYIPFNMYCHNCETNRSRNTSLASEGQTESLRPLGEENLLISGQPTQPIRVRQNLSSIPAIETGKQSEATTPKTLLYSLDDVFLDQADTQASVAPTEADQRLSCSSLPVRLLNNPVKAEEDHIAKSSMTTLSQLLHKIESIADMSQGYSLSCTCLLNVLESLITELKKIEKRKCYCCRNSEESCDNKQQRSSTEGSSGASIRRFYERKLSNDSGRVTFSDSGESGSSEFRCSDSVLKRPGMLGRFSINSALKLDGIKVTDGGCGLANESCSSTIEALLLADTGTDNDDGTKCNDSYEETKTQHRVEAIKENQISNDESECKGIKQASSCCKPANNHTAMRSERNKHDANVLPRHATDGKSPPNHYTENIRYYRQNQSAFQPSSGVPSPRKMEYVRKQSPLCADNSKYSNRNAGARQHTRLFERNRNLSEQTNETSAAAESMHKTILEDRWTAVGDGILGRCANRSDDKIARRFYKDSDKEMDNLVPPSPCNIPKRARSRSLFVVNSNTESPTPTLLCPPYTSWKDSPKSDTAQITKLDFTKWLNVASYKTFPDAKTGVRAYDITALPRHKAIAVTDADKVKIKIYNVDGELKYTFGTPTWPRYGRGVTLTKDKRHIAVCHLTEICVYTLDGVPVKRISSEEFTTCWGIACDRKGNYVATDPKRSSVFIINSNGRIIDKIGGNTRVNYINYKSVHKSQSWKNNLSSTFRRTLKNQGENDKRQEEGESLSLRRLSNLSLPPIERVSQLVPNLPNSRSIVRLIAPRYVTVNSKNHILVTDTKQRSLLVFEMNGNLLFSIGGGRMGCESCIKARRASNNAIGSSSRRRSGSLEFDETNNFDFAHPNVTAGMPPISKDKTVAPGRGTATSSFASQEASCSSAKEVSSEIEYFMRESSSVGSRLSKSDELMCSSIQLDECEGQMSPDKDRKSRSISFSRRFSKTKLYKDIVAPLWLRRRLRRRQQSKKEKYSDVREIRDDDFPLGVCEGTDSTKIHESQNERVRKCKITGVEDDHMLRRDEEVTETTSGSDFRRKKSVAVQTEAVTMTSPSFYLDDTHCRETTNRPPLWDSEDGFEKSGVFTFDSKATETKLQSPQLNQAGHFVLGSVSSQGSMWESASEAKEGDSFQEMECRRCHVEDPRGVCVDDNDNILLVDRARHRITLFTSRGHFLRHVLTEHDGLHEPKALCVLHDGSLAVTDSYNIIKIFHFSE